MNDRQRLGHLGEDFAAKLLTLDGYEILERNFRCKDGEIDIVAEKDNELYFIEVKTRKSRAFGDPYESVTREKQRRLRKAARCYLGMRQGQYQYFSFQIIEVGVNQIENAF